jgi:hypothetical protein
MVRGEMRELAEFTGEELRAENARLTDELAQHERVDYWSVRARAAEAEVKNLKNAVEFAMRIHMWKLNDLQKFQRILNGTEPMGVPNGK